MEDRTPQTKLARNPAWAQSFHLTSRLQIDLIRLQRTLGSQLEAKPVSSFARFEDFAAFARLTTFSLHLREWRLKWQVLPSRNLLVTGADARWMCPMIRWEEVFQVFSHMWPQSTKISFKGICLKRTFFHRSMLLTGPNFHSQEEDFCSGAVLWRYD